MIRRFEVLRRRSRRNVAAIDHPATRRRRRRPMSTTGLLSRSSFAARNFNSTLQRPADLNSYHSCNSFFRNFSVFEGEEGGDLRDDDTSDGQDQDQTVVEKAQLLSALSQEIDDNVHRVIESIESLENPNRLSFNAVIQSEESSSLSETPVHEHGESASPVEGVDPPPQQTHKYKSIRKLFQRKLKQERRKLPSKKGKKKQLLIADEESSPVALSLDDVWNNALRDASIPYSDPASSLEDPNRSHDSEIEGKPLEMPQGLPGLSNDDFRDGDVVSLDDVSVGQSEVALLEDQNAQESLDANLPREALTDSTLALGDAVVSDDENIVVADTTDLGEASHSEQIEVDMLHAICKATTLLSVMTQRHWNEINDTFREMTEEEEEESDYEGGHTKEQAMADFDRVEALLEHAEQNNYLMKTLESNMLLSRLLTATDLPSEDVMIGSLKIFHSMKSLSTRGKEECAPNATTYRLMISALSRRFPARGQAVDLFRELTDSEVEMDSKVFLAGLQACQEKHETKLASKILYETFCDKSKFKPSIGAYLIVLDMLKYDNSWREGIEYVAMALQPKMRLHQSDYDLLLISLSRWPEKSRNGELLDNSQLHKELLSLFQQQIESDARPGFSAWVPFLERICRSAKIDYVQWDLALQAFKIYLEEYQEMYPNKAIMKIGLQIASAKQDAAVAAELVTRLAKRHVSQNFFSSPQNNEAHNDDNMSKDTELAPSALASEAGIPYMFLRSALEISLAAKDVDSTNKVLSCFDLVQDHFPDGAALEFYGLGLLGYARYGYPDNAKDLLERMSENGLNPSEELYGAVIHSLATADRHSEAKELFQEVKLGLHGDDVQLGTSCFNALVLSYVRSEQWESALALYEEMESLGVPLDSSTVQGFLLASYRSGGKGSVISTIKDLLRADTAMGAPSFDLALKMLAPKDVVESTDRRQTLRAMGEEIPALRSSTLNLIRSIRIAEVEDRRNPNPNLEMDDIVARRSKAWKDATSLLLVFSRDFEESRGASPLSSSQQMDQGHSVAGTDTLHRLSSKV